MTQVLVVFQMVRSFTIDLKSMAYRSMRPRLGYDRRESWRGLTPALGRRSLGLI